MPVVSKNFDFLCKKTDQYHLTSPKEKELFFLEKAKQINKIEYNTHTKPPEKLEIQIMEPKFLFAQKFSMSALQKELCMVGLTNSQIHRTVFMKIVLQKSKHSS